MVNQPISLADVLGISLDVLVVDIGANAVDGTPPYQPLLDNGLAQVIGFEPNAEALADLNQNKGPRETYLPHAVADGSRRTLNFCRAPGMTSLLEPNQMLLAHFHGFPQWSEVLRTEQIDTVRLDDVAEISDIDLLKIDVQGAELLVFQHAPMRLANCVVIQTEVEFLPMYKQQPLFSEVELHLRAAGFVLHKFDPLVSRALQPMIVDNDIYGGLGQLFWADAVFIRDFTNLSYLPNDKLLKMAIILHDVYKSYDIVLHILREYDLRCDTRFALGYTGGTTTRQK